MKKFTNDERLVSWWYRMYIAVVYKTSKLTIKGDNQQDLLKNSIIGFWHQDSFAVNFLLKHYKEATNNVNIIITADKRGNYIEGVIQQYGAKALRMPDGARLRHFLGQLKEVAKEDGQTLCIALDGPLGPYHEPKKLAPMLAAEGQKSLVLVKVEYKRCLKLYKRWDNYCVPLPFGHLTFTFNNLGEVQKEELRAFKSYQEKIFQLIK